MILKTGVKLEGVKPEIVLAMNIVSRVMDINKHSFIITSVTDGMHSPKSLHYKGLAFDMRTRDIAEDSLNGLVWVIKRHLKSNYDVVLESDHIHIEFDPKNT